jgi:hypothetical protein
VQSELGKGTTVTVVLPLDSSTLAESELTAAAKAR